MLNLYRQLRYLFLIAALFLLAIPVFAQEEGGSAEVDTTFVVLGAFVTIGVMTIGLVVTAIQSGKSVGDAAKAGAESALRGVISNKDVALWGEERLNYLPSSIRRALTSVVDVYDPVSPKTASDLDDKTQRWLRNLLDGDSTTGAVD